MFTILLAQKFELAPSGATPIIIQGPLKKFGSQFTIGVLISQALPYVYAFAGIALLLMLLAGGFGVLTSAADPKKLEKAKQRLTYAVVGFIIIFVAYWVVQLVGTIFGLKGTGF